MNARQIRTFKTALEEQQRDLTQRIQRLRDGLAVTESGDSLDKVRGINERESTARALAFEIRLLDGVREALREIQFGTFGRCAACDGEIPLGRLNAVPWSPYCIRCQESAEAGRLHPPRRAGDIMRRPVSPIAPRSGIGRHGVRAGVDQMKLIYWLGLLLLLLIPRAAAAASPVAGDAVQPVRQFAGEARELIVRLDVRAREFQRNAGELDSLAFRLEPRSSLVHLARLNMLKEDLARIAEMVSRLDRNRNQEDDWQVHLTDRILPRIAPLRESIQQAIALIGKSDQPVWEPNFRCAVGDIRDQASGLARTFAVFLNWANTELPMGSRGGVSLNR